MPRLWWPSRPRRLHRPLFSTCLTESCARCFDDHSTPVYQFKQSQVAHILLYSISRAEPGPKSGDYASIRTFGFVKGIVGVRVSVGAGPTDGARRCVHLDPCIAKRPSNQKAIEPWSSNSLPLSCAYPLSARHPEFRSNVTLFSHWASERNLVPSNCRAVYCSMHHANASCKMRFSIALYDVRVLRWRRWRCRVPCAFVFRHFHRDHGSRGIADLTSHFNRMHWGCLFSSLKKSCSLPKLPGSKLLRVLVGLNVLNVVQGVRTDTTIPGSAYTRPQKRAFNRACHRAHVHGSTLYRGQLFTYSQLKA